MLPKVRLEREIMIGRRWTLNLEIIGLGEALEKPSASTRMKTSNHQKMLAR